MNTLPSFTHRHIGPNQKEQQHMLNALGLDNIKQLIDQTIPASIRLNRDLNLPEGISEAEALAELRAIMAQNNPSNCLIGQGYHPCETPSVLLRNLFENAGWYTAYTPYQPEISQGRLELLFHFQTLITELTGLPISNASLLDEGTAIAEAVGMAYRQARSKKSKVVIANSLHPQSLDVLQTRASTIGFNLSTDPIDDNTCACVIQYPDTSGIFGDHTQLIAQAKAAGATVIMVTDPLALVLTQTPAALGADIAVGSIQRFGVPMGNGGPHAAYIATTEDFVRIMPGRVIGESIDKQGNKAYRLALQTREQHIRREKATSNICTAQALLANMATAYAIWHGSEGLHEIAHRIHTQALRFRAALQEKGFTVSTGMLFDTVAVTVPNQAIQWQQRCQGEGFLIRLIDNNTIALSFNESITEEDLAKIAQVFDVTCATEATAELPSTRDIKRFLTQPVFQDYHSETEMMRYLKLLENRDLALNRAMIPLGSCTMKLNAAAEMRPVSWRHVAACHPFAPLSHNLGYQKMIEDLDTWLSEITGFATVNIQPNAGSQGEYSGLLAIKRYQESIGEGHRNICLIPTSAHGTNPASAQMAGYKVVAVKCIDPSGDIDLDHLKAQLDKHASNVAAIMITYPSTHGVFEESIADICDLVHEAGGQVYLDGANMNALVGLCRLQDFGADCCHLNLHKTFCIPHGGGGPGIGPVGLAAHLAPFGPGHKELGSEHPVASAPHGSASILPIPWMYIRLLGSAGLRHSSEVAILSANYIAKRLHDHFPVLFTGTKGRVAHECILDPRRYKAVGVSGEDIAKRLMDYGFHAPTMSWPVIGTLMVEPTESEPFSEVERFIDAMIGIRAEIARIEQGEWSQEDNPIVNAPHTMSMVFDDTWEHSYSRKTAAFPLPDQDQNKYWPTVARVDNTHGDLNLVCSCPPMIEAE